MPFGDSGVIGRPRRSVFALGKLGDMNAPSVSGGKVPSARAAAIDVIVSAAASVIILGGGWLYPVYYLSHDPDLQRAPDPDFRAAAAFPLAVILGLVFAVRACWLYVRARRLRSPGAGLP